MAACSSLQNIFENPLPQNPTLIEPLSSWGLIKPVKNAIEDSSYVEYFGDISFKDRQGESFYSFPIGQSSSLSSSASSEGIHPQFGIESLDKEKNDGTEKIDRGKSPASYHSSGNRKRYEHSDSFSSQNSENLSLCTESLGFESSDDMEDLRNENWFDLQHHEEKITGSSRRSKAENSWKETKRSRTKKGSFPPPISCIGRTGKPWVCLKSHRQDGRFILQEVRIPTQEFLHACREDGRLRIQLIQSDDEILEGDEEEEDDDEDDDFGNGEEMKAGDVTVDNGDNHL